MKWIEELIGIPWKYGGNSVKEGFDCYGLFQYVQNHYFIRKDFLPIIRLDAYNFNTILKEFSKSKALRNWNKVEKPRLGDAVLMSMAKYPIHIGTYVETPTETGVLHTIEGIGVIFQKKGNLKNQGWKINSYYRHKSKL